LDKKNILIFIDWFTPGYKAGGPVSSNANMIVHLKDNFHFKVITRNTEYMETVPYPQIEPNKWLTMQGFDGYYIDNKNLSRKNLRRLIKETDYDIAYVNGIYSWYFSILPLILLKHNERKVIVSARGMLSEHAINVKSAQKRFFLAIAKLTGLYKNIRFHATNIRESEAIAKSTGIDTNIAIAPNLPIKMEASFTSKVKDAGSVRLIYIARIAPEKNNLFALQVLSQIKDLNINILFDLYGPVYNQQYKDQCEEVINGFPPNIKTSFKGPLERNKTMDTLKEYHFLFMPSTGENYGHVIVEAMVAGCPVILSDRTPWRNLGTVGSKQSAVDSREWAVNNEQSKVNSLTTNSQESTATGIGWDLPLNDPKRFAAIIEYCARMGQDEYDAMSMRAFEYAKVVTEDPEVLEANKKLFE
jgi:glycosyltransferase involved in cell wall biosynthesis